MQVQLNTDTHVQGDDKLHAWLEQELKDRLSRFADQLTRIEVHLSDVNSGKGGEADKRCALEVRLAGRKPVAVSHQAGTVADAVHGAAAKLVSALDTALGRVRDARGRETIRGQLDDTPGAPRGA
jgi:ribosome-associated translation inhibitor RaiA